MADESTTMSIADRPYGLRYLAVAETLRERIQHGTYQAGEQLPPQHDLAKTLGVSFATLKVALDMLEREKYVWREAGRGTFATLPEDHAPVALVIDDDQSFCAYLTAALLTSGWKSAAAGSGREAMEKIGGQSFDLVFLDLVMPGMNGAETFRAIRRVEPTVEVVVVTGYPDSMLMEEALRVGPFAVIRKPFTSDQLRLVLTRVERALTPTSSGPVLGRVRR